MKQGHLQQQLLDQAEADNEEDGRRHPRVEIRHPVKRGQVGDPGEGEHDSDRKDDATDPFDSIRSGKLRVMLVV